MICLSLRTPKTSSTFNLCSCKTKVNENNHMFIFFALLRHHKHLINNKICEPGREFWLDLELYKHFLLNVELYELISQ